MQTRNYCTIRRHNSQALVPFDSGDSGRAGKEQEFHAILDSCKEACNRFGVPKLAKAKLLEAFALGEDCYSLISEHIAARAKPKKPRKAKQVVHYDVRIPSSEEILELTDLSLLREAVKGWLGGRKIPSIKSITKWRKQFDNDNEFAARVLEHINWWSTH